MRRTLPGAGARSRWPNSSTTPRSPSLPRRDSPYDRAVRRSSKSQIRAWDAGLDDHAGRIFNGLAASAVEDRSHAEASRHLDAGIAYCSERGLELYRLYLLGYLARHALDQGRWSDAADSAASVLRIPRTSTTPRIHALAVLALVRARRGDPDVWPLLDEAWTLAALTGELPRL